MVKQAVSMHGTVRYDLGRWAPYPYCDVGEAPGRCLANHHAPQSTMVVYLSPAAIVHLRYLSVGAPLIRSLSQQRASLRERACPRDGIIEIRILSCLYPQSTRFLQHTWLSKLFACGTRSIKVIETFSTRVKPPEQYLQLRIRDYTA